MINILSSVTSSNINYPAILLAIFAYIFSFWVLFCFWVFIDSQKRYKNFFISVFFFFLTLIIGIPALLFYLIVRPEREDENVFYLNHNEENMGGVNVPVINFMGKDGVEMTLQLKINKPLDDQASDMKVSVDFNTQNQKESFIEMQKTEVIENPTIESTSGMKRVSEKAKNFRNKIQQAITSRTTKKTLPES